MVINRKKPLCGLIALLLGLDLTPLWAAEEGLISEKVSADACDERRAGDDAKTAENRAVDKASLAAVKLSAVIQKRYPGLSTNALDLISYRIIDEYMVDTKHTVTLEDAGRVCVKLQAAVEMTADNLAQLIAEYRDSDMAASQVVEVAEKVNEQAMFKPSDLTEKKLLFVRPMNFWNGEDTDHYRDLLTGLFSHSEYFYVTNDAGLADYVVTPRLLKAEVDEIDNSNHKMQMQVELDVVSRTMDDFTPLTARQTHFILFAADSDEQEIADNLLRKLLTRAAEEAGAKIDKFAAARLEEINVHGK